MYIHKNYFLIIGFFLLSNCFVYNSKPSDNSWIIPVAGVSLVVVGGSYATGCMSGNILLHYIRKWYAPDYERLVELDFDKQKINDIFIPYIMERHGENYFLWIDFNGSYRDFPLVKYKRDLDSYIRKASFLSFFVGSAASREIKELIVKMKKLREIVISHPIYLEERKLYIKIENTPHVYVNNYSF